MGALGKGYTYGILISCFIKEDEERRGEKGEGENKRILAFQSNWIHQKDEGGQDDSYSPHLLNVRRRCFGGSVVK